jgi:hypothetical protein
MQYATAVPFRGNLKQALDLGIATLTSLGFRIVAKDSASLELTGPGMYSTRQSPLLGASRIQIAAEGGNLAVHAELGGVEWMSRFIQVFPATLCLLLFLVMVGIFAIVQPQSLGHVTAITGGVTGANLVVWLLLGPRLTRYIQARSCRAIDSLVGNMAAVGRDG